MTHPATTPLPVKQYFIKLKLKKKEWKKCLVISIEIIADNVWLYLPSPRWPYDKILVD